VTLILTERLELHSLSPAIVAALIHGDLNTARALAPQYEITERTFSGDAHVLRLRNEQLIADPSEEPWLYRAAVLRSSREVVGRVGFHSSPNADGTVEIGYATAPKHRRRGFALEMARGLLKWGAERGARRCLASVRPDNEASLTTIAHLGFVCIGEQIDEIDGLEWVHALDL
jgi:ribosomal-protein-alanine N-acetyltransferase